MSDHEEQLQKILKLKRYEKPREGYFEDFLKEFQSRQRSELLHRSSLGIFFERVATWLREVGPIKWVAGAGAAYALFMATILLWPGRGGNVIDSDRLPASFEPSAPVEYPAVPPVTDEQKPPGKKF